MFLRQCVTPLLVLFFGSPTFAEPPPLNRVQEVEQTSWTQLRKKLRARSFHEWMTPSVSSKGVPTPDGGELTPSNFYGYFWLDYEFAPNWRLLYWQREILEFSGAQTTTGIQGALWDPRFGIRKTQVFDVPGLTTNYDLFFQPGVSVGSAQNGKYFDLGIRTNTNYAIPGSRWSIGMVAEVFGGLYDPSIADPRSSNFSGFVSPWINYNLSDKVSTQHWLLLPFQHRRADPWSQLSWDLPTDNAVIQNGIGVDVSDSVWVSLVLNNYLNTAPTLQNTWLSLWVNITYL